MISQRLIFLLGCCLAIVLIFISLYLQYFKGFAPCPLCILQRIALGIIAFVLLVGAIHSPKRLGVSVYNILVFIFAVIGALLAWHQINLQKSTLPPSAGSICLPDMNLANHTYSPIKQTLQNILPGGTECNIVHGTWLGLTIPGWTLLFFGIYILFAILGLVGLFSTKKRE